jgi:DNA-binding SARP family transcriptional activator
MEFRILGPLEVVDDGRPVAIHRGKERALLAYALLHANELLPVDRLIDELWGEQPPPTAPKILQNTVSRLRKALGDGRLVTQAPGYRLRLEAGELDLHRFDGLAEQGRATGDADLLREALALWRGEPLADLRDEPFAQRAALHLEESRLAVLGDQIDADLAAGRHAELVPELEQLSSTNPLGERPYGQLMLALYRAGRQGDALETYQRARTTLNREIGVEPSRQLQELERKVLTQDSELQAPPSRVRPGPDSATKATERAGRRRLGSRRSGRPPAAFAIAPEPRAAAITSSDPRDASLRISEA